jgi:hypothetical protein
MYVCMNLFVYVNKYICKYVFIYMYAVGSKRFRPDIQKPRQMEKAVREI